MSDPRELTAAERQASRITTFVRTREAELARELARLHGPELGVVTLTREGVSRFQAYQRPDRLEHLEPEETELDAVRFVDGSALLIVGEDAVEPLLPRHIHSWEEDPNA